MSRLPRAAALCPLLTRAVAAALLITSFAGRALAGPAPSACSVDGKTSVAVQWKGPAGAPVSAIKLRLGYPADALSLPGRGTAAASRVTNTPESALVVVNDLDDAVEILVSRTGSLLEGQLLDVDFDRCSGAASGIAAALSCTVLDCASSFGPVQNCSCTVTAR